MKNPAFDSFPILNFVYQQGSKVCVKSLTIKLGLGKLSEPFGYESPCLYCILIRILLKKCRYLIYIFEPKIKVQLFNIAKIFSTHRKLIKILFHKYIRWLNIKYLMFYVLIFSLKKSYIFIANYLNTLFLFLSFY